MRDRRVAASVVGPGRRPEVTLVDGNEAVALCDAPSLLLPDTVIRHRTVNE